MRLRRGTGGSRRRYNRAWHSDAIRAVVFDVGNTLWFGARWPEAAEIERLQAAPLRSLLAGWGMDVGGLAGDIVRAVHEAGDEAERVEQARGSLREVNLPLLIRGALAAHGIEITAEQADELWRATWILERNFGVQLYPDSLDVLREVQGAGLLVGINTNRPCTAEMHLPGLRDFGIARYVDAVVCSGDTGFVKPHPSTFELVLDRLGVAAHRRRHGRRQRRDRTCAARRPSACARSGSSTAATTSRRAPTPTTRSTTWRSCCRCRSCRAARMRRLAAESLTPHDDDNEDRY